MRKLIRTVVGCGFALATSLPAHAADTKKVAISMIVEVPQLVQTKDGVLAGLSERNFSEGKNLSVQYQTANGSMPTQQQIARKFVGDAPDAIVAITTPTSQSTIRTTKIVQSMTWTSFRLSSRTTLVSRTVRPAR